MGREKPINTWENGTMKTVLRSPDLTCPSCVDKIEQALRTAGVETARVHFTTGRIEVWHDPERVSVGDLVRVVRSTGYEAKAATF
jgi:copper chaperone CopZ